MSDRCKDVENVIEELQGQLEANVRIYHHMAADAAFDAMEQEKSADYKLGFLRGLEHAQHLLFIAEAPLDHLFVSGGDIPSETERARSRVQAIADNIANDGTPMDAEKAEIIYDLMESAERCDPAHVNHVLNV